LIKLRLHHRTDKVRRAVVRIVMAERPDAGEHLAEHFEPLARLALVIAVAALFLSDQRP